jgi:D-alanyl-D-alanine carboxypeptidase/D-alanyl-D-alanine-endopeptidase (penicillin-binding protein 4)
MLTSLRKKILLPLFILFLITNVTLSTERQTDNLTELQDKIDSIVSDLDCNVSVQIVSASKYDILYEYNPDVKMIPASVTKLVTSATALMELGPGYYFKTIVFTDDINISDGIINGNIYLKGYGDPDLNSSDISLLAEEIAKKNIKEITGNIIYDESYLDEVYYGLANYYQSDTELKWWPYISGINLDKNKSKYDPAVSAAELLAVELTDRNIKFEGITISGFTPSVSKELAEISHSIHDIITYMNKVSNNHSAITVFKVIGAKYKSPPGSLSKGSEAVINFLTSIGIDRNTYEILEGSGLTRYNMVTSGMLIRLLKYMYDQEDIFDYFYNSLSIAGVDGTLRKRMIGTEAENNIRAKTGTLNSVTTLSGYAVSRDHELILFFIAMNGFKRGNTSFYRSIQDDICEIICQFSRN